MGKLKIEVGEQEKMATEFYIMPNGEKHCAKANGSLRAWFRSKQEAETFAASPANHPTYLGDVAHLCRVCEFWHLSRPEWLAPEWLEDDF